MIHYKLWHAEWCPRLEIIEPLDLDALCACLEVDWNA